MLEIEWLQSEEHKRKAPHQSALFSYLSHVQDIPKFVTEKELQLWTEGSLNHPQQLEREEYQSASGREHSVQVYDYKKPGVFLRYLGSSLQILLAETSFDNILESYRPAMRSDSKISQY